MRLPYFSSKRQQRDVLLVTVAAVFFLASHLGHDAQVLQMA